MNKKTFIAIPHDIKVANEKQILKSEFKKPNNKVRYLIAYNNFIVCTKKPDEQPKKYLKLDFDTKFEVVRENPIKKSEDDDSLGPIIGLTLMRDLGNEILSSIKFLGSEKLIKQWRDFFQPKINQWQFHHMFRVFKKIGKGNFASVYMAERIEDGQKVAVKAFSKQAAYSEEHGKEAIVNELTIMRKLSHYHLMKMHEIYETQNSLYVTLELLDGGSLYDLVKEKALLSTKQIQQILVGILLGLVHMHKQEIMHRDLKLENILFKQPKKMDSVVIADFGLATHVHEPVYLYCRCGTPGYVAPEVINIKDMKAHYSSICDIYSLGLVFYLLLSGKPAFPGKSYATVVKQNREASIDFSIKQLTQAPPKAIELLKLMLEKDPNKRITAENCLKHPFLFEISTIMAEDQQGDSIDEGEDYDEVANRMSALNEESAKFDAFRKNNLINSPASPSQPKHMHQQKAIDSNNQVGNSPILTGKTDTVDSIPNIGTPKSKPAQSQFQASPMLKPSQFKQNLNQQTQDKSDNKALLKYAQKKN